jgi:hypothetical protein
VNSTTGVASFVVPLSGSCTVDYRLCYGSACDTATLTVTGTALLAIPTLSGWGLLGLVVALAVGAFLVLRKIRA